LLIFAGGGYGVLSDHEGSGYAEVFSSLGFHAFVCRYRVDPNQRGLHPAPLEDALYAIAQVRDRANECGFEKNRVGVIGSSAGGHLAAHLSTAWEEWGESYRPDWTILCYPVIALYGPAAHAGSSLNLLGSEAGEDCLVSLSPQNLVTPKTPPAFLWHTLEDQGVPAENSLLYAEALRRSGVPFEIHITEKGRHGLGVGSDFDWPGRVVEWVESTGRVKKLDN